MNPYTNYEEHNFVDFVVGSNWLSAMFYPQKLIIEWKFFKVLKYRLVEAVYCSKQLKHFNRTVTIYF